VPTSPGRDTPHRQLAAIDHWIAAQDEDLSRPEAIRRLVEMALEGGASKRR
jgi:hypothetical protein